MNPVELSDIDLEEMEAWKRRNQEDRFRMLDEYARWLRARGILKVEPRKGDPQPRTRRTRRRD